MGYVELTNAEIALEIVLEIALEKALEIVLEISLEIALDIAECHRRHVPIIWELLFVIKGQSECHSIIHYM